MAMVGVDSGSLYRRTHSLSRLAFVLGRRPLGAVLHSSNEPGELSQWLWHDYSTINIVLDIIIIIISIIINSINLLTQLVKLFRCSFYILLFCILPPGE